MVRGDISTATRSVLVETHVQRAGQSNDWLDMLDESFEFTRQHEPDTVSYVAATSLEEEDKLLLFQKQETKHQKVRLRSKGQSLGVLCQKMNKLQPRQAQKILPIEFRDVDRFGFWKRENMIEIPKGGVIFGWSVSHFEEPWMRDMWIKLTTDYCDFCFKNEPETLIFSGGIALWDNKQFQIEKGDLIFITAYTSQEAKIRHGETAEHARLVKSFAENGVKYTMPTIKNYQLTDHGFLWR